MFVDRDAAGKVKGVYARRQYDGQEDLADDHADIAAFLSREENAVPQAASSGDFIHALWDLDWLGDVKTAVAAVGGLAEDLWTHAATFERHHPLVLQIATAIGKTESDLDMLFRKTREYR